ncbi:MAG: hypothetical protein S4CHLAM2_01580 [Chlamydiales bacterium]|nr:hypothetical protein [Chlamydiales bacterium]
MRYLFLVIFIFNVCFGDDFQTSKVGHTPSYKPQKTSGESLVLPSAPPAHTPSYLRTSYQSKNLTNPEQGNQPEYEYPQTPMQREHHNEMMGTHKPQVNPEGPNAHQRPGDESTLPNH